LSRPPGTRTARRVQRPGSRSRYALHASNRRRVPNARDFRPEGRRSAGHEIADAAGVDRAWDSLERLPHHELLTHGRRRRPRADGLRRSVDGIEAGRRHWVRPAAASWIPRRTGLPARMTSVFALSSMFGTLHDLFAHMSRVERLSLAAIGTSAVLLALLE